MIITENTGFWEGMRQKPLCQRLGSAPDEIISYVTTVNAASRNSQQAFSCSVPTDFLNDVRDAIEEMPRCVQHLLDQPLLGVYFGQGLGSSAITDVIVDKTGKVLGLITAVDLDLLHGRSANAWASWKENTPFAAGSYKVQAVIEDASNDNRKNAIQYLLLHEFGHVLTAGNGFLPDWWIDPQRYKSTDEYSFLPVSWQLNMSQQIIPLIKDDFALRKHVCYYTGEQLANEQICDVYKALGNTRFATLYAATNAYDDFAESFVSYVHSVLMKKPLEIRVLQDDKVIMTTDEYWRSKRCAAKLKILDGFLR